MGNWGSNNNPTETPAVETTTQSFTSYVTSATNDDPTITGNISTAVEERLPTTSTNWNEGIAIFFITRSIFDDICGTGSKPGHGLLNFGAISTVQATSPTSTQKEFILMIIIYVLLAILLLSIVLNIYLLRKLRSRRTRTQKNDSENHGELQTPPSDSTYDVMYKAKPETQNTSYDTVNIPNDVIKHNHEEPTAVQNGISYETMTMTTHTISSEGYGHIASNTEDIGPDNLYSTLRKD